MIKTANTKLYQNPVLSINAAQKPELSPVLEKPTIEIGINIIA